MSISNSRVLKFGLTFEELYTSLNDGQIDMTDLPIPFTFKKSFFEDDFVERGMVAYLVDAEKTDDDMIQLHFYFDPRFFQWNKQFLKECFYSYKDGEKCMVDAVEAGEYKERFSAYVEASEKVTDYLIERFNSRVAPLVFEVAQKS